MLTDSLTLGQKIDQKQVGFATLLKSLLTALELEQMREYLRSPWAA